MPRTRTSHEAAARYARGSLQRFLNGKAAAEDDHSLTLPWIIGVIESSRVRGAELAEMFDRSRVVADLERFEQVRAVCRARRWLT